MVRALSPSSSLVAAPYSFLHALLLLAAALVVGRVATAQGVPAAPVRVGVILDWKTPASSAVSLRWRTGIKMAVEDYYAAHPGSATRVELLFRDSQGDVVGAASAAVDLIKNAQVQAIIGAKTSAEAEFMAHLGSHAHVPVLSYSATSPSLSPVQTPYFVRTAANDSFQATPVAAILANFGWRAVAVLHEDSPYGAGILPALADALQSVDNAAIVDRVPLPSRADGDALDALLYRLKAMPTRVFVVHANFGLAARLFRRAWKAGMMSDGYVWVATDGVGSFLDRFDPEELDFMEGVVSLRPHVEFTDKVKNFSARFRARFRRENPASDDDVLLNDPTVTRLWSYDTAWAIAAAAEAASVPGPAFQTPQNSTARTDLDRVGVSATGAALLKALLNTTFDGMAGRFKLVDGQLQVAAYEVLNIIGNGANTVGFWTPESGISRRLHAEGGKDASKLKPILWPGETPLMPRGWAASPNGRVLNVSVPVKHGFKEFVDVLPENSTTPRFTGYCIDVFDAVMKNLSYPVRYQYVPYNDSSESYDMLVDQVSSRLADIAVGDVTITASRMNEADFTMPFTDAGWAMVVATRPDTSDCMWIFLQPLTTSLWLISLAFFCFTGFVVWVIEHRVNPEFRGTPWQQFGLIFYFSFSTLVFAHKEKLESNLSRFVVIIWVFVVLILTSSYTASLTSMLTVQQLRPTVTDVKELQRRGQFIGYQEGTFIEPMLKKLGFDEQKMMKYSTAEDYADALSKGSAGGGVDAVFDEIPYLKVFLSQYCDGRYVQAGPVYKTDGFGFVFPRGSPMVADVSREILRLAEGDKMALIEKKWFGEPGTCRNALEGNGGGGSSNLSFQSFGGLFLITGVVSSLMLLLYVFIFAYREREELREAEAKAEAESGRSGSVSVRRLRAWMQHYDRRDLKAPTFKGWNDESVRNGSDYAGRTPRWAGGDASLMTPRAGGEDHAMGGTSPLSVYISPEMNAGSSPEPEGTPASEISESFEQRIEGAAAAVEMTRPTDSQLQQ